MLFTGDTVHGFMVYAVLTVAPSDGFQIQFCDRAKNSAGKEVIFYEADQALHFALSERMPWLAELCLETDCFHEHFIIFLPERMAFQIPPDHDTLHVICQYIVRDSHISKSMDHPYKKIF